MCWCAVKTAHSLIHYLSALCVQFIRSAFARLHNRAVTVHLLKVVDYWFTLKWQLSKQLYQVFVTMHQKCLNEMSKAYLHDCLVYGQESTYCVMRILLPALYHKSGHYQSAIDHCEQVLERLCYWPWFTLHWTRISASDWWKCWDCVSIGSIVSAHKAKSMKLEKKQF